MSDMLTRWKRAIEGLTPGGSEFVDDPERCAQFIKDRCNYPKQIIELRANAAAKDEALRLARETLVVCRDAINGRLNLKDRVDKTISAIAKAQP